jgi:hypothetical protein
MSVSGLTTVSIEHQSSSWDSRTSVTRVAGSGPPRLRVTLLVQRQLLLRNKFSAASCARERQTQPDKHDEVLQ